MIDKLTKFDKSVLSNLASATKLAVSPTFGRVSKIVFMLVWPLVLGGGLRSRIELLYTLE